MKKITAELVPLPAFTAEDIHLFTEWVWAARSINLFDPDVLTYPRTVMCRAGTATESLLFIPLQSVLMWDAIAPKPGLSPREEALCLWRIGQAVDQVMLDTGHREAYFMTSDDRVADICARHGFEEVKGVRLMKKKLRVESTTSETIK